MLVRVNDDITICLVDAPADPGHPGAIAQVIASAVECNNAVWREVYGHDDFSTDVERWTSWLANQKYSLPRLIVALEGPVTGLATSSEGLEQVVADSEVSRARVVGVLELTAKRETNTHLVSDVEMGVLPTHRRRGIGSALVEALEQLARAWGRTTVMGYGTTMDLSGADDADIVRPAEGPFAVRRSEPASRLMLGHGWRLAQTERYSRQDVPALDEIEQPAWPSDYEPVRWAGPLAGQVTAMPELPERIAALHTAFSHSIPRGELDAEPTTLTVEKLLHGDEQRHREHESVSVVARHVPTGELVALTELARARAQPEAVYQEITVVLPEHRGHGLGRLVKLENLRQAAEAWPDARRVHTWNAGENDHMWAVNESIGYRTRGVATCWQKKLG